MSTLTTKMCEVVEALELSIHAHIMTGLCRSFLVTGKLY